MRIVVFAGPSLWSDPILKTRTIDWLPPATQGDVYRVARSKPFAIGLIDGGFEIAPSVWHKEILWTLSRGVHVFGAASMGALRACELAPFGMTGIGTIFRDFQSGRLTDDDEVAVLHEPRELGYRPITQAMVDVRATIHLALAQHVISPRTAAMMLDRAKTTFFKDRTWAHVISQACRSQELSRFARWLPANQVELKRRDARAMIRTLQTFAKTAPGPFRPSFKFSRTQFWDALVAEHHNAAPL